MKDELHKLRKLDSRTGSQYEAAVERREGINKAVQNDVQHIFKGKLYSVQNGVQHIFNSNRYRTMYSIYLKVNDTE